MRRRAKNINYPWSGSSLCMLRIWMYSQRLKVLCFVHPVFSLHFTSNKEKSLKSTLKMSNLMSEMQVHIVHPTTATMKYYLELETQANNWYFFYSSATTCCSWGEAGAVYSKVYWVLAVGITTRSSKNEYKRNKQKGKESQKELSRENKKKEKRKEENETMLRALPYRK